MVELRKSNPTLVYGKYNLIDKDNKNIYAYTRVDENNKILVLMNFSKNNIEWKLPGDIKLAGKTWINNYPELINTKDKINLKPYQAVCLQLQ